MEDTMTKPHINVTPLIDVLLVLLIIFMVVTPLRPSKFAAKIPQEPHNQIPTEPNPLALVVSLNADSTLRLNTTPEMGTTDSPEKLVETLRNVFRTRLENGVPAQNQGPGNSDTERTVFIKAPRTIAYGNVAKVVDAVKFAGASPISLQIDNLD